jgi:hypothetical protein
MYIAQNSRHVIQHLMNTTRGTCPKIEHYEAEIKSQQVFSKSEITSYIFSNYHRWQPEINNRSLGIIKNMEIEQYV